LFDRRLTLALWAFCGVALITFLFSTQLVAAVGAGLTAGLFVWGSVPADRAVVPVVAPPGEQGPDRTIGLIDAIDDPLLIVAGQRIAYANAAAVRLFGADKLDGDFRLALRHPLAAELLQADDPATPSTPIELTGIGEEDRRWSMTVHRLDGGERLVRLRDRTESWVAERMRVDFVANASHELRTPLATLIGFIETLTDDGAGGDPATRGRFLGIMMGEARRMQQLVNDLMSLSRIEADRFSVPQTPIALKPVIEEVTAVIRTGSRDPGDRIQLDLEECPDVPGDRAQIAQLLHNLIGNAIKYGRPGTPIRVSLAAVKDKVQLRVEDEGEGIAPEHLEQVFKPFFSTKSSGMGLGLAVCQTIVTAHNGRLWAERADSGGTRFLLALPAAKPQADTPA